MAAKCFSFQLIFFVIFIVFTVFCLPVESDTLPRGVSRAKSSLYKPGSPFTCLDGSETIPFEHINDDYCDCKDGSDEPGTSACSNGQFYCMNKGYRPESIPSSRVSDGVCDCCDGSDEYDGKVNCPNNCVELGRTMREEFEAMKRLIEEGHRIRGDYVKQGREAKDEKQQQLEKLGPERELLLIQKDDLMRKKTEAEEPEREAKEEHENWWKEQKALREAERDKQKALDAFQQLDGDKDDLITADDLLKRTELNPENSLTVEEVKASLMSGYDSVEAAGFVSYVWPNIKDKYVPPPTAEEAEQIESPPAGGEAEPPAREPTVANDDDDDDDDSDFDEDDFEEGDEADKTDSTKAVEDNLMPAYPDATRLLMKAADAARDAYKKAEEAYNTIDKEIQEIEKFLSLDLGPDDVFYPLRDQCFEFTDREYTYKICPYDKATQRPKGGGSETNLGTFTKWEALGDDQYSIMKFEKGTHCWNGPDRSASVRFHCGKENQLTSASEPNRCEYAFDFTTPAACHTLPDVDDGDHYHPTHTEL